MITVFSNNKEIPVNKIEFSDGAITYKLNELPDNPRYISINIDPSTPVKEIREEIELIMCSIESFYLIPFHELECKRTLNIPYLPYGRADRLFEKGNPIPLNSFLVFVESCVFDEVNVCDAHNLNSIIDFNITNKTQLQCFKDSLPQDFNEMYDFVISPDKGAITKSKSIADFLGTEVIYASKNRDIKTGRILETFIPNINQLNGSIVLIPDDLCDGGGTFIHLAEALRTHGVKEIHLYITHGIFSKGLKLLDGVIDKVYCYHTVSNYINKQDILNFNLGKL